MSAPAMAMVTPNPEADVARRAGLRRMRTIAVSLLLLAAVVYLATLGRHGVLGFVNAGAEASMVGAIADWFAVTAIFRHPLGLPVPHTALIPRRKDELGRSLQEFVGENFLQEQIIRDRIATATIALRVGRWAEQPVNARRIVDEGSEVATIALGHIRDEHIVEIVESVLVPRLREEPLSPLLGTLLMEVVRDDLHHPLVDLVLDEAQEWLGENEQLFSEVLGARAPWWTPTLLNDVVTTRLHKEAMQFVADVRDDPHHHARVALDSMLGRLARDLLHDEDTQVRTEALKDRLLGHPQVASVAVSLWTALRRAVLAGLNEAGAPLRDRLQHEVEVFAHRLTEDTELRERLDEMAADLAVFAVTRYGGELTSVITSTIDRWDGDEAARRIELHVGRDLQFIRINGTLVGGLVGLVIHAVTVIVT